MYQPRQFLRETTRYPVYDADGAQISRRDYVGQFEFVADTLERTLLPEGYITAADSTFHAYIPDYQGNIVGVYNSSTNTLEQFTDYYPYGLPHASATAPTANRRKYGAKELTTDHGLNLCDFAARWHNPAFPAFTTVDPLAEKYYPISPYSYCADEPVNLIDPSGMEFDTSLLTNEDFELWTSMINFLCECSPLFSTLYKELENSEKIYTINSVSSLAGNADTYATASFNDATNEIQLLEESGKIMLNPARIAEELFHAYQSEIDYDGGQMNKEFEAKIFVMASSTEFEFGPASLDNDYEPFNYYYSLISENWYSKNDPLIQLKHPNSTAFTSDFVRYANDYVEYCKMQKITNPVYLTRTTTFPRALKSIYDKTY